MRIAVIAPPWLPVPPSGYGGIERVLDGLCRGLVDEGHEVLLYATGDSTCPVERSWGSEEPPEPGQAASAVELGHVLDAYRKVNDWRPDVVHDHTLIGPFVGLQRSPAPVVTTNHGPFASGLLEMYRSIGECIPIIAISRHQASTASDVAIATVIHHGIDASEVPFGERAGGPALFLGRMSPTKGVEAAVRAARAAGVPLQIAAKMREPEEHDYFESTVEPLLGDGIEYLGEVSETTKRGLLADASCLVNPIAWPEPFGMVMIEAFSCGTPVIASPMGAAPEIVEHGVTGYLCPDDAALVDALKRVHTLDRRSCRAAAETYFSSARMARQHAEFYERVVAEARAAAA